MTMWAMSPEICDPDFVDLLVTMTAMNAGSGPAGGGALLPGSVLHVPPHTGAETFRAKPLNDDGAELALRTFTFHHCELQKVTVPVVLLSPITNAPAPEPPPVAKP